MQESKHFWDNYLTKLLINLKGIWYAVETCWCDDPQSSFFVVVVVYLIFKGENPTYVISLQNKQTLEESFT